MAMNLSPADSAAPKMLGADIRAPARGGETMDGQSKGEESWLDIARQAHDTATNYLETRLRQPWKESIAHFQSEHAPGSKYHKVDYAHRSRAFRPKTRSMVLRKEAAAAGAFFSMDDMCGIKPVDQDSKRGQAAAAVMNALVNHRLKVSVPWFLVSMGNYQTSAIQGICCSKQYWDFEAEFETVKVAAPVEGEFEEDGVTPRVEMREERRPTRVKKDKPCILPIPPENLLFHPNADWLCPIESSPYVVYKFPMFALDVKKRAKDTDPKTHQPTWRAVTDGQLATAAKEFSQTIGIRDERKKQEAAPEATGILRQFDTVWVHENFVKKDGKDWVYYTLGTTAMLSDPKPIEEVYFHGERPFVIGIASLEAFTAHPQSKVKQVAQLQRLANEISNQRIDNVRLAMNGRYWVKEGKKVDLTVLQRSVPGSAVLMSDPSSDVKWDKPSDVTASAYQEQDRINVDFDDLGGMFSAGTVQSDNHLNETVGGMKLMSSDATAVQEYELKVFAVTYMEPVLRQLVKLEQAYETDMAMIALAGKMAQSLPKYGVDPTIDDLMDEELLVSVSVGVGATSPDKRIEKLKGALSAVAEFVNPLVQVYGPEVLQSPGVQAIASEIFGAAGYKDGERFLDFGPPKPPEGQEGQQGAGAGPSPEMAQQLLQFEGSENEKDREKDLAVARIRDQGETTRTVLDGYIKTMLKGIDATIKGRNLPNDIKVSGRPAGGKPPNQASA